MTLNFYCYTGILMNQLNDFVNVYNSFQKSFSKACFKVSSLVVSYESVFLNIRILTQEVSQEYRQLQNCDMILLWHLTKTLLWLPLNQNYIPHKHSTVLLLSGLGIFFHQIHQLCFSYRNYVGITKAYIIPQFSHN